MLKLLILILSVMILTSCPSNNSGTTDATKAGLILGTENPVVKECNSGKAYLYKDYEIHVEPSPELEGMNIFLYSPGVSEGNPCNIDRKNASHIISTGQTEGNNFFAGIYGNYLFIDQGTGPDLRVLSVYDLNNKKLVLYTDYSDAELKDGVLSYFKTLVPTPGVVEDILCPDAEQWKEQGLTVLYEQRENFDLNTETRVPVEDYRCRAGQ